MVRLVGFGDKRLLVVVGKVSASMSQEYESGGLEMLC